MRRHTPGPWRAVAPRGMFGWDVRVAKPVEFSFGKMSGQIVCQTTHHINHQIEAQANAHLIAKALEMLELLQKLRDEVDGDSELIYDHTTFTCRYGLRSILEKITLLVEQMERENYHENKN